MTKPIASKGAICPFHNRDVSRVCHTCELYEPQRVVLPSGEERDHWACSLKQLNVTLRSMHASIDGLQAAIESLRNEMVRREDRAQAERTAMVDGFMRLMRPDLRHDAPPLGHDDKKALT